MNKMAMRSRLTLGVLPAVFLLASGAPAAQPPIVFRGESCQQCHTAVRDRAVRSFPDVVSEGPVYDAVIVGGGMSGLASAYFLKDKKILVLEKEGRTGGHARRETWDGLFYPVAAVYMCEPEGLVAQ